MLWESWHGEGEYLDKLNLPTFVCVLPPNLKSGSVHMILRTLYSMWGNLQERVAYGASPHYPKQCIQDRGWAGPIIFGCDPYLTARRVDNLRVITNQDGTEDLHFVIHDELDINGKIISPRACVLRHDQRRFELGDVNKSLIKSE